MEQRLLFVDDERSILRALERLFCDFDGEILTAESGEEGLKILLDSPVDIVISDMRMPKMNGHQFLKKVKVLYPSTTRLILSGYADEKEILNSLIDGSNNLYLLKPWNNEDLTNKIGQILEARQIYRNDTLLNRVKELENLSLITGIYDSVCRLIEKNAEVSSIARVIETDAAVTASILRVVNSAFYYVKTGSVIQAINFLGLAVIKSIVLSCSLLKPINFGIPLFNVSRLNSHASKTNLFMTKIYTELLKKSLPDHLVTAGLLHNLGLVLCIHYFPEDYRKLGEAYLHSSVKISLAKFEKESFGMTHAELGGYFLDWWGIPYPIVECALFHHDPLHRAVMDKEAVSVIHLANYYAWKNVHDPLAGALDERVFDVLKIDRRECEKLFQS
jgi:HD-like signal output (HDOD) protein/CheY-like chemotaxis protein